MKPRGELVRYDVNSKQFLPMLPGIAAFAPTFSRDGEWVAYTSYPDHTLWRSGHRTGETYQGRGAGVLLRTLPFRYWSAELALSTNSPQSDRGSPGPRPILLRDATELPGSLWHDCGRMSLPNFQC